MSYSFKFEFADTEEQGEHKHISFAFEGKYTWPEIMEEFRDFLQGCGFVIPQLDLVTDNEDEEEHDEEDIACDCRSCEMGREFK